MYAVVTLPDGFGKRRDMLLGRFGTAESREAYARAISEWQSSGGSRACDTSVADITIAELTKRFWPHVQSYYRHAGT